MSQYEVYPLSEKDMVQLKVETKRKRVPYSKIVRLLAEGNTVFIPVGRKMASYIRKQLENRMGMKIESFPSKFRRMDGYTFKVSLVHELLRKWSDERA